MTTREKGRVAEEQALAYLSTHGLKLVEKNYTCRMGEIDLIMRDRDYLVFVEVRARVSAYFGGAIASITYAKQQKVIKSALHYIMAHEEQRQLPMRFDVLTIDGKSAEISWIKDAFGA